jgi:hypothetical protein
MKWLHAEARNICHGLSGTGEIETVIEGVLYLTEKALLETRVEKVSFALTPGQAATLAKAINQWADDAMDQAELIEVRKVEANED